MAKKNVADSAKRERRSNKEVAVECLQDGLNKVFKHYSAEDYLTVIVDSLKVSTTNISKKTYTEMSMQELLDAKEALQKEITAIDKQMALVASRVTAPANTTISAPAPAVIKEEEKK